jgi:hypothetical protein
LSIIESFGMRVRIFIDYWNFAIDWQHRAGGQKIDWTKVPSVFVEAANTLLARAALGPLTLEETRVYASFEPGRDGRFRDWLHGFLDRQPGVRVFASERHWKQRPVRCRDCGAEHSVCPACGKLLGRAGEKTVDARIVTDLMNLAWEGAYDVALLVTSDKDFKPAVEALQDRNLKVVNARWRGLGYDLSNVCWASFEIDPCIPKLVRA